MMLSGKKSLGPKPWFGFCLSIALGVTLAGLAPAGPRKPAKPLRHTTTHKPKPKTQRPSFGLASLEAI